MTRTTYIPPAEVPAAEALKIEPHKQDDLARLVVIPIIQNVIGGVAVAGAILTVQGGAWIIWGWWSEEALLGAVGVGALVAFVATFIRFFADDFGLLRTAYRAGQEISAQQMDALRRELNDERREHADTEFKLRTARSELNSRTVHLSDLYGPETRQRAAQTIEYWFDHNQKQWLSREIAMDKNGTFRWTKRQWEDVQDLLRRSKLSRPAGTSFELTVTDMEIAWQMMRLFFADPPDPSPAPDENASGQSGRTDESRGRHSRGDYWELAGEWVRAHPGEGVVVVGMCVAAAVIIVNDWFQIWRW
jgi:hypothetical protein